MATKRGTKSSKAKNTVKLFQKNVIEGKSMAQCAEEMELSRNTLQKYKRADDFRQMAISHLEGSTLKGLKGTMSKLVDALDAKKPIITENADGSTNVSHVADMPTQLKALQEVHKIYGLYAPTRKDTTVTVSISSDAELFEQIDQAQRSRRHVESYIEGERGLEVVKGESDDGPGSFGTRERALLHDGPIQEQIGWESELAVSDNSESTEV